MEIEQQPQLKFHSVAFVEVHFSALQPTTGEPNIDFNVDAKLHQETEKEFRIWMEVKLIVPDVWELKVAGLGFFEITGSPTPEIKEGFVHVNGPAIMFPYFRAFVSTLTSNTGGASPIVVIPPHFFHGKLEMVAPN